MQTRLVLVFQSQLQVACFSPHTSPHLLSLHIAKAIQWLKGTKEGEGPFVCKVVGTMKSATFVIRQPTNTSTSCFLYTHKRISSTCIPAGIPVNMNFRFLHGPVSRICPLANLDVYMQDLKGSWCVMFSNNQIAGHPYPLAQPRFQLRQLSTPYNG